MLSVFPVRSGYSYKVAVALSLFLGWLGADRFYLGYPALGTLSHTHSHTHTHTQTPAAFILMPVVWVASSLT